MSQQSEKTVHDMDQTVEKVQDVDMEQIGETAQSQEMNQTEETAQSQEMNQTEETVEEMDIEQEIELVVEGLAKASLSDTKEDDKALADEAKNVVPTASFAFVPSKDDVLVETFEILGRNECFKCHSEVKTDVMLLCECGYFLCRDCFLTGCFCTEKRDEAPKEKKQESYDSYAADKTTTTTQEIDLDGEIFELECTFYNPIV